jgi:hypothetical protein
MSTQVHLKDIKTLKRKNLQPPIIFSYMEYPLKPFLPIVEGLEDLILIIFLNLVALKTFAKTFAR